MKIAVLGTGVVGQSIATRLLALGHEVKMGSRIASNEKLNAWVSSSGSRASGATFAEAAAFGELVFNCTRGTSTLEALRSAGADNLRNKILIDVSNPLDFSKGIPPALFTGNTDSLGEQVQRAFPETQVVKTLNTVGAYIMVDPARVAGGDHDVFVSGNDGGAKAKVVEILRGWFGWKNVIDLGDITTARGTESYLALWVRLWGALGTAHFNIKIAR
ncbi:MAG: NAD(P)-binding domain-containing protein [Deltaproteobacteria bacterium]|nr:NAD(P)-binding domain-containing protein [Deltaproteobacteria bacterium]